MIGQFDFSQKGWVSGKGRGAVWRDIPRDAKIIEPQFLMARGTYLEAGIPKPGFKVAMMDVTSATNARTVIAAVLDGLPCGHKVPTLVPEYDLQQSVLALAGIINSVTFDFLIRSRLGGQSLIWGILEESAFLSTAMIDKFSVAPVCARLALTHSLFAPTWLRLRSLPEPDVWYMKPWKCFWAVTPHEHLRLRCILDAIIAELYALDWDDLTWFLRNCDQPVSRLHDRAFYRTLDPKGFWRVDKDQDPELRHTVLSLVAFRDLKDTIAAHGGDRDRGIEAFYAQNGGEGWMLPETLRLSDFGLGHDERARQPEPVRERLGPRFLPWQLAQSVEDSWAECALHARNLLGEMGFARLQRELRGDLAVAPEAMPLAAEEATPYNLEVSGAQRRLFPGEPTLFGDALEDPAARRRRRR